MDSVLLKNHRVINQLKHEINRYPLTNNLSFNSIGLILEKPKNITKSNNNAAIIDRIIY